MKRKLLLPAVLGMLGIGLLLPAPAMAQFSTSYKFLESVRKKEAEEVTNTVDRPGSTIINTRDSSSGETALHIVTARRDSTWMGFLIGKGANVNLRDNHGATPLTLASNLGFVEGAQILVDHGARVDEPSQTGETPLIAAVHRRDVPMMRVLLKAGADPSRKDNSGRSAREYAELDSKNSNLVTEIDANARKRSGAAAGGKIYGPTF